MSVRWRAERVSSLAYAHDIQVGLNMTDDAPFFSLRCRAYELAESGKYKGWSAVAEVLHREGFLDSVIRKLDGDGLAVMMITRCCEQARDRVS